MSAIREQTLAAQPYAPTRMGVTGLWWPPSGRYTIKAAAKQRNGGCYRCSASIHAGRRPPLHIHHDADETFYPIDGELTILVGGARIEAHAGDFVLAPKGISHAFLVGSERA